MCLRDSYSSVIWKCHRLFYEKLEKPLILVLTMVSATIPSMESRDIVGEFEKGFVRRWVASRQNKYQLILQQSCVDSPKCGPHERESDVWFSSVCRDYRWLIKKLSWACAGNRARWGKLNEMLWQRRQSQRAKTDAGNSASKPQSCGNTHVNRNGIN